MTEANTAKTLLLVEDDEAAREALTLVLRHAGYEVVDVGNGKQAFDYLRTGNLPDLIILDMLMPVMDGWRFLEALRRCAEPVKVPILIATATILTNDWARQHGCAGLLRKPVEPVEVLGEIRRCLKAG